MSICFHASGIQEYVEAVSFLHYIRHRSLISLEEINARLVFMRTEKVKFTALSRTVFSVFLRRNLTFLEMHLFLP